MPTIKDIAKEAGVSHGTVSNVINGRGNVSVEKIRLVWEAADKLGYKVNTKAKNLRQGSTRTIAILLPGIDYDRNGAMYEIFQSEFIERGFSVQLYSTQGLPAKERECVNDALTSQACAIISASVLDDSMHFYQKKTGNIPTVLLNCLPEEETNSSDLMFVSFDMFQAGREIALSIGKGQNRAAVFGYLAADRFFEGFRSVHDKCECYASPNYQIEPMAFELVGKNYTHIICMDEKRAESIRVAWNYIGKNKPPHIITITAKKTMSIPDADHYELDDRRLAHKVVKALCARLDQNQSLPPVLNVKNDGFRRRFYVNRQTPAELSLLSVASPSTSALQQLLPYLKKQTGIQLNITACASLKEEYEILKTEKRSEYDLVRMDVAWMDEMVASIYKPLDEIEHNWDALLSKVIDQLKPNYSCSNGIRYSIPFDPSTQLLFYRKDLFTDPIYMRMYFERYKRKLDVPNTYKEYNRIAEFFTRESNPASPTKYGTTIAIGNVSVSPSEFIPRLFAEGGSLLDSKGRIALNTEEAISALRNYREAYSFADKSIYDKWKNVLEGFTDGSAAMTVVFINYASYILNLNISNIAGTLGVAPVPGGIPLLGGGILGVSRESSKADIACDFFEWLYSDSVAPMFTMLGGLSPCKSAYSNREINNKYPWLPMARKSFNSAHRRGDSQYYKNFSELRLEEILADNIRDAVTGRISPTDAVKRIQDRCDKVFEKKFIDDPTTERKIL